MRLGLYQTKSPAGDISAGVDMLNGALLKARAAGCDILVMPELFLPGYGAATGGMQAEGMVAVAQEAATEHGVALAIGLPHEDETGLANGAFAFAPDGTQLADYAKIQLFGQAEAERFVPGEAYAVFDFKGVRFGLLVCYDVEFPEHVRALKRLGAEVILVPTANMMPFVNVNTIAVPARAMESAVTIVYANYRGSEGELTYTGLSGIFGPDGYPLASKGQGEGLCIAELPEGWREHDIPLSTQLEDLKRIHE